MRYTPSALVCNQEQQADSANLSVNLQTHVLIAFLSSSLTAKAVTFSLLTADINYNR